MYILFIQNTYLNDTTQQTCYIALHFDIATLSLTIGLTCQVNEKSLRNTYFIN